METQELYTAFEGTKMLCRGNLLDVVVKVKRKLEKHPDSKTLIFSDQTGKSLDFNLQGTENDVKKRLEIFVPANENHGKENLGPGRPKLGVVSREISLLPRHWEWLAAQPGGASVTLRKLVEAAKKSSSGEMSIKQTQERSYRFMMVAAGDLEGFEEATRALYRKDKKSFKESMSTWPRDVREHALELADPIF